MDLSKADPSTKSGYEEVENHLITVQDGSGKDALWADKTMKPVNGEADTYDITLTTQTTKEIKEIITSPNTAVALVFDVSGSMSIYDTSFTNPDGTTEQISRLEAARRAANVFLDDYVESAAEAANDVKRMLAVAGFAEKATENLGWTDVANGAGSESDSNSAKGVITNIEHQKGNGDNGTDISSGLEKAASLLKDEKVKDYTHKYVILLTDGAPSYNSSVAPTEAAAAGLKADGVTIFTIAFDVNDTVKRSYKFQGIMECEEGDVHYHSSKEVNKYGYEGGSYVLLVGYYFTGPHSGTKEVDEVRSETISVNSWLQNHIATPTSSDGTKYYYTADNADQLKLAFGGILTTISKLSKAWTIEDPIGGQFTFQGLVTSKGLVSDKGGMAALHVAKDDDNKLTWAVLDSTHVKREDVSTEPGTTVWKYTYEMTYRVKLNTEAEGFVTGKEYPANGKTTLYYTVDDDGNLGMGDTKPQDLYVPTAWGTVPDATYTIEFYKMDRTTGEYVLQEDDSLPGTGKLWETVVLWAEGEDTPAEYAGKYASAKDGYYQLTKGDRTARLEAKTGTTLKFYYDPTPVDVKVEHYLTTTETTDDGVKTEGPDYFSESNPKASYYKGDVFSADAPENLLLSYEIDSKNTKPADYQNVTLDQNENVIKVYYIQDKGDNRSETEYTINYFYRESKWEVSKDTGFLTETWPDYPDEPGLIYGPYDGLHKDEKIAPLTEKETDNDKYSVDKDRTPKTTIILDKNSDNVLNIYLQSRSERPASDATLQITHVYKRVVVGGALELDGTVTEYSEPLPVNADETYYATIDMNYDGKEYDSYTTDQDGNAMSKVMEKGHNEIVVTYVRDARVPTDVTVEHYFYQNEWEIDENGDAQIVTPEDYTEKQEQDLEGTFYVGGSATAASWPLSGDYAGYSLNNPEDLTLEDLKAEGNVIKLYYYRDPLTDLDGADVTVVHTYNTYTTYIDTDGKTVENELSTNSKREEKVTGVVGEWFMAEPDFTDAENNSEGYYQISPTKDGTEPEKVTLTTTNAEFPFTYERHVDARVETGYTVRPILVTYSRFIDPATGETVVEELTREDGAAWSSADQEDLTVYFNQRVSVTPTSFDPDQVGSGFEFDANDSGNTEDYDSYQLGDAAEGNVIYLVFAKTVDNRGEAVDVVVRNHYTFDTYVYQNGQKVAITDPDDKTVPSEPVSVYLNQFFDTTDRGIALPGYAADEDYPVPADKVQITADGLVSGVFYVDFYWYGSMDKTDEQKATVQVIHHYTEIDLDGDKAKKEWTVGDQPEDIMGGYYATQTYVAGYNFQNGLFNENGVTDVDPEGATDQSQGVVLVPGNNVIHIYYERSYHSRVSTSVEITHNYYAMDTFAFPDMTHAEYLDYVKENQVEGEFSRRITMSGRDAGAYVGAEYTAQRFVTYTVNEGTDEEKTYTYTEAGADPEGGVIASLLAANGDGTTPNRVTISYIREFDSRQNTSVTVYHKYFTEDSYTESRSEDAGLAQEVTETTFEQGVWVGAAYTAKELLRDGYSRETEDSAMRIESLAPGGNSLTVTYVRRVSSDPGNYTVNVYHMDGVEGKPQQAALSAYDSLNKSYKVGEGYSTQPVPTDALDAIAYKQLGEPTVEGSPVRGGVVNVTYTYGPKADISLTVNYNLMGYDEEGNLIAVKTLETATTSHKEGYEYNFLPAKEFAGYAYLGLSADSAPAAGTLKLGQDVTVTLQYTAQSYPFRVDFINDDTGERIETVWDSGMTAPFGSVLSNGDVAPFFAFENDTQWQRSRMPAGYHIDEVKFPTMAVSPNAERVEGAEGEEPKFDPTPITNVVEVHYDYTRDGGGGGDDEDSYRVRVEYLEKDTEEELADTYESGKIRENRAYDVSDQVRKSIAGYTIDSIDGDVKGSSNRDVTITVWYVPTADIDDNETPGGNPVIPPDDTNGGEIDIEDNRTPQGGQPGDPSGDGTGSGSGAGTGDGEEVVIIDNGPPKGPLPQTGTLAQPTDPTRTLGMLALALSMAAAGLMITIGRKREEEE